MNIKKTTLATALLGALSMGFAGQAAAGVYASSRLLVEDFSIGITNLAAPALTGYTFTTESSATLNGSSSPVSSATCGTIGSAPACPVVSPVLQSAASRGAPVRSVGGFSYFGPGVGQTYANAGGEIFNAEVLTGTPSVTSQIAETEIAGTGVGNSQSVLGSETTFVFNFTVASGNLGDLTLSFKANPDLYVAVNTPLLINATASATLAASFNLHSDDNDLNVSWAPNGQVDAFGLIYCAGPGSLTCTETADGEALNFTRTLGGGNPSGNGYSDARYVAVNPAFNDKGLVAFGIELTGLPEGDYSLSLTSQAFVRAEQAVPEPGTILLLGGALAALGLGGARRRVGRKAA